MAALSSPKVGASRVVNCGWCLSFQFQVPRLQSPEVAGFQPDPNYSFSGNPCESRHWSLKLDTAEYRDLGSGNSKLTHYRTVPA